MSLLRGLALFTLLIAFALPASAQTCDPACTPPLVCVHADSSNTVTICRGQGTDTAAPGAGPSEGTFASFVYNVVVPAVDFALMPLLYAIAFLVFLVGMVRLFFSDSEEKRKSGKQFALWGIIGFFVLFSVWGIVRVFLSVLPMGA